MAPTESVVAVDELLREEAGSWCLALAHRRLQRLLPLVHGSVSGAIRFLDESQATAAAEMEVFHQGHDAFLRLQQALPRFEHLRELHTRSLVQRQCAAGPRRLPGGKVAHDERVEEFVGPALLAYRRGPGEQGRVQFHEDQENDVERQEGAAGRAERSLAHVLHRQVLRKVHK